MSTLEQDNDNRTDEDINNSNDSILKTVDELCLPVTSTKDQGIPWFDDEEAYIPPFKERMLQRLVDSYKEDIAIHKKQLRFAGVALVITSLLLIYYALKA